MPTDEAGFNIGVLDYEVLDYRHTSTVDGRSKSMEVKIRTGTAPSK